MLCSHSSARGLSSLACNRTRGLDLGGMWNADMNIEWVFGHPLFLRSSHCTLDHVMMLQNVCILTDVVLVALPITYPICAAEAGFGVASIALIDA